MKGFRALALIILWDVRKLGRYKFFLAMRFTWFLLQVLVFGLIVAHMVSIRGPYGLLDYYKFYVVGAYMAVLFSISIMRGHEIVEELEDGLIDYQLSLPIERRVLAIGRTLGGGISSFTYSMPMLAVIIMVLGVSSLTSILLLALVSFVFSSGLVGIAMSVALWLRSGDKLDILMGISDSLLVRLSTIFYPIVVLTPITIYYYLATINPVSHATDLLRIVSIPEYALGVTVSDSTIMASYILGFTITSILAAITLLERRIEGGYGR